jgi:hypothetical protein
MRTWRACCKYVVEAANAVTPVADRYLKLKGAFRCCGYLPETRAGAVVEAPSGRRQSQLRCDGTTLGAQWHVGLMWPMDADDMLAVS